MDCPLHDHTCPRSVAPPGARREGAHGYHTADLARLIGETLMQVRLWTVTYCTAFIAESKFWRKIGAFVGLLSNINILRLSTIPPGSTEIEVCVEL